MPHPSPRTAQINPAGTEWWEIRAAIADILFDGLDGMRDAIRQIIGNGQMQAARMFE